MYEQLRVLNTLIKNIKTRPKSIIKEVKDKSFAVKATCLKKIKIKATFVGFVKGGA